MKCKIKVGTTVRQGPKSYEWTEKLKDVELFIRWSIEGQLTCMFPEKDLHLIGDCCNTYIEVNETDVIKKEKRGEKEVFGTLTEERNPLIDPLTDCLTALIDIKNGYPKKGLGRPLDKIIQKAKKAIATFDYK